MNNKKIFIPVTLLSALLLSFLCTASVFASDVSEFAGLTFVPAENIQTHITDINGNSCSFNGALDTGSLEQCEEAERIAYYSICAGDEELLIVELHDIELVKEQTTEPETQADYNSEGGKNAADTSSGSLPGANGTAVPEFDGALPSSGNSSCVSYAVNGYYSVDFAVDEETNCFLTGLTPENLSEVQSAVINSKLSDTVMELTDLDFIDTEKNDIEDSNLCWAASTSNILHYTGWGKEADFKSSDGIFDLFVSSFGDYGGRAYPALEWFFNGTYVNGEKCAEPYYYGEKFTGKLSDYAYEPYFTTLTLNSGTSGMKKIASALCSGCGIEMGVSWNTSGGHSITLWGYVYGGGYSDDNMNYYSYLIVSDSDTDIIQNTERRCAPNNLHLRSIVPSGSTWRINYSDLNHTGNVEDVTILYPFDDSYLKETEGSKNRFTDYELYAMRIYSGYSNRMVMTYSDGNYDAQRELRILPSIYNSGTKTVPAGANLDYTLKLISGSETLETITGTAVFGTDFPTGYRTDDAEISYIKLPGLEEGEYTLEFSFNESHDFGEAYYTNNTVSKKLTIGEPSAAEPVLTPGCSICEPSGSSRKNTWIEAEAILPADGAFDLYVEYGTDAENLDTSSGVISISGPALSRESGGFMLDTLPGKTYYARSVLVAVSPDSIETLSSEIISFSALGTDASMDIGFNCCSLSQDEEQIISFIADEDCVYKFNISSSAVGYYMMYNPSDSDSMDEICLNSTSDCYYLCLNSGEAVYFYIIPATDGELCMGAEKCTESFAYENITGCTSVVVGNYFSGSCIAAAYNEDGKFLSCVSLDTSESDRIVFLDCDYSKVACVKLFYCDASGMIPSYMEILE